MGKILLAFSVLVAVALGLGLIIALVNVMIRG